MKEDELVRKFLKAFCILLAAAVMVSSGAATSASSAADFEDVKYGDWFYEAVDYTARERLFLGTENGRFEPYLNITREEMAAFLFRYTGHIDRGDIQNGTETLRFPDTGDVAD